MERHYIVGLFATRTSCHVLISNQLRMLFSALAFSVLMRKGIYPPEMRSVNLDFDWTYRRLGAAVARALVDGLSTARGAFDRAAAASLGRMFGLLRRHHDPASMQAQTWSTRAMALWVLVLLLGYLVLYYV